MTWWAIDVRTTPEERDRLGAWLVARTGQAVEERADGTLVVFAPDDATAAAASLRHFADDARARIALGAAQRTRQAATFTLQAQVAGTDAVYLRAIERRGGRR